MKTRIGVIGSGYMASEYLKASAAVNGSDIVAIYSRNLETAQLLAKDFGIETVARELNDLQLCNLDFLIICVPELATKKIIADCAPLSLPMLVEKPVGINYEQALEIEALAQSKNLKIFVALNRRFYSSTLNVMSEVTTYSNNRFIRVIDQENSRAALEAGQPIKVVENWMYANSIHIIDYISTVCRGEPRIVNKSTTYLSEGIHITHSDISFSSGDIAQYLCYWNTASGWSVDINIGEKSWQLAPLEVARSRNLSDRRYVEISPEQVDLDYKPGLVRILQEVVNQARIGISLLPTLRDANRTMELIEMIYFNE